jgi:hypothetical protein
VTKEGINLDFLPRNLPFKTALGTRRTGSSGVSHLPLLIFYSMIIEKLPVLFPRKCSDENYNKM